MLGLTVVVSLSGGMNTMCLCHHLSDLIHCFSLFDVTDVRNAVNKLRFGLVKKDSRKGCLFDVSVQS